MSCAYLVGDAGGEENDELGKDQDEDEALVGPKFLLSALKYTNIHKLVKISLSQPESKCGKVHLLVEYEFPLQEKVSPAPRLR